MTIHMLVIGNLDRVNGKSGAMIRTAIYWVFNRPGVAGAVLQTAS